MSNDSRPLPRDVARRAFALGVYMFRVSYEERLPKATATERKDFEDDLRDMADFLHETKLIEGFSTNERVLFGRHLGKWHPSDVKEGSWRGENLLVLLWAIRERDRLPPIWEDSDAVHHFASDRADDWQGFVDHATLRPEEELERMEGYVQSVRLRERTPDGFEGIPWLAEKSEGFGGPPPIEGDLSIKGRPYRTVDQATKNRVRSLALERHKALCWLLGYEVDPDAPAPEV